MRARSSHLVAVALVVALTVLGPHAGGLATASAQSAPRKAVGSAALLPGANSHDPVSIESAKLDYFDKEQKLIYTGDVVARQGASTLRASVLTIFLSKAAGDAGKAPDTAVPDAKGGASVRRMEAVGPVSIVSKDEVGAGDNGSYDKAENKITLVGNVTLSQGTNIIKGDKLVYDMNTGQAQVSSGQGRVSSVFTPGTSVPKGEASRKPKHDAAAGMGKTPVPSQAPE